MRSATGKVGKESASQHFWLAHVERIFLIAVFAVLLVPFVGMLWAPTTSTTENRVLAAPPSLTNEDGVYNLDVLADAGAYFEDHFAYRNQMVSTNARLRAAFGSSATDQVVVGTHGWLYYAGTLPDYLGQAALSERELRTIAHNIKLLQVFAESCGAQFVFTVAPNKNSLYSEYMPSNYVRSLDTSNWERLLPYLDEYGVNYVDLFETFEAEDEVLYYTQDTHWNNKGALLGGNAILKSFGLPGVGVSEESWVQRNDYTGDIAKMLYPYAPGTEAAWYAPGYNDGPEQTGALWQWARGSSVEEDFVSTASRDGGKGTLVMFRDSFANALIPYYSVVFDKAVYTKLVPYDAATISVEEADYVVVERAERHLDYLAYNAPIMPAPGVKLALDLPQADTENASGTRVRVAQDGGYTVISGELDERLHQDNMNVYLEIQADDGARIYETSWLASGGDMSQQSDFEGDALVADALIPPESDYGFAAYLPGNFAQPGNTIRVICTCDQELVGVHSYTME